ncbi:serine/threonine protein kinase [Streptosporangium sp. CA-115845]|uniref:serine/threonine protein kinase n=1 Tax=Streptosporangium sp. CA-115845 TaxID=3240071 RepID=UPI003D89D85A
MTVIENYGEYVVAGTLGSGGQATVHLGVGPDGERVAIKVLLDSIARDPDALRRFEREAAAARRVAPFCTARVLHTGVNGGRPYLVSEYVPGPSLHSLVRTDGPRTGSGLDRLAVATLAALVAIHRAGVIHRDFKPSNIIMGPEGPVVIDFGIARAADHLLTHNAMGTPAYMSPEQFEQHEPTPATDLFSWALTMIFAATGRRAFPGEAMPALMYAILTTEPDLTGVPSGLLPLLRDCLAKDPAARPTAAALLSRFLHDNPGLSTADVRDRLGLRELLSCGPFPDGSAPLREKAAPPGPALPASVTHPSNAARPWWKTPLYVVPAAIAISALLLVPPLVLSSRNEGENVPVALAGAPVSTPTPSGTRPAAVLMAVPVSGAPQVVEGYGFPVRIDRMAFRIFSRWWTQTSKGDVEFWSYKSCPRGTTAYWVAVRPSQEAVQFACDAWQYHKWADVPPGTYQIETWKVHDGQAIKGPGVVRSSVPIVVHPKETEWSCPTASAR